MEIKNQILIILFLLIPGLSILQAQEALSASGGDAGGSGGLVSYTLGQIACTAITGTGGEVSQGVQQPNKIYVLGGIENGISLLYNVFPNPTHDILILKIGNFLNEDLIYQLFDLNGKLLQNRKVESGETPIGLGGYGTSIFLLKVTDNRKELKTFLIIKN
jgi:hypothetical protein